MQNKKFYIRARAEIYADYEVEAKTEEEAIALFLAHKATYKGQDTSNDHNTVSADNIVSVQEH